MAGGPSSQELVAACSAAGALGGFGFAYTQPAEMEKQAALRARADAGAFRHQSLHFAAAGRSQGTSAPRSKRWRSPLLQFAASARLNPSRRRTRPIWPRSSTACQRRSAPGDHDASR